MFFHSSLKCMHLGLIWEMALQGPTTLLLFLFLFFWGESWVGRQVNGMTAFLRPHLQGAGQKARTTPGWPHRPHLRPPPRPSALPSTCGWWSWAVPGPSPAPIDHLPESIHSNLWTGSLLVTCLPGNSFSYNTLSCTDRLSPWKHSNLWAVCPGHLHGRQ